MARTVLVAVLCIASAPAALAQGPQVNGPLPQPLPLLPADNWWNLDITSAPVDASSASFVGFINNGGTRRLHPDWGGSAGDEDNPNAIYGMPFVVVPGNQPLVPVTFGYDDESDVGAPGRPAGYPLPEQAKTLAGWIEGGDPGSVPPDADRHMLVVDRDNRILYELYQAHWNADLNRWEAGSGAVFPLTTNLRRPDGWTSADAAGLAILPGLVRYDEAFGTDPIRHALRVTVRATNHYVFPASHHAGSTPGALPMGARLRLKASVNISTYPAYIQRIMQAMKTYGLIVADNGTDMYITGTSDPRWEANMGQLNTAFNALNASMFEVVQLGWNPATAPPADADGDGLPSDWESAFGLNPNSSAGDNGATGDPDGDGVDNAHELAAGTHPKGLVKRLFAEGASNDFFTTHFAALNTNAGDAHVQFRFLRTDGTTVTHAMSIPAYSRVTLDPRSVGGGVVDSYSTVVESDVAVVVDRTMTWDATGYGSHAETGLAAASTTWFLAEGATHGSFDLFYLIQNPGATSAEVTVRYLRPAPLAPLEKTYAVLPNSRFTIYVDREIAGGQALDATDVSAAITSSVPIVVERSMYMTTGGQAFSAGHESAGVIAASTSWFLAEGATGAFFDMFILIANPDPALDAVVHATYLLPDGSTLSKDYAVARASRLTISVDNEDFGGQLLLANATMSTILQSAVPVVVERSMWWPGGAAGPWYEAHNSPGATSTGTAWALAEGEAGGPSGASTYILVANTSATPASVRVTVYVEGGGTPLVRSVSLAGNSRFSVDVAGMFGAAVVNHRFGALVESLVNPPATTPAAIVVERAMYTSAGGRFWAAGTNALATKIR